MGPNSVGTGVLSRVKVAGVHKPPSIAEVTNEWSYTSTGVLISPLARPGRKQARKHVRDARDFNNIETRAVIKFLFLQVSFPAGTQARVPAPHNHSHHNQCRTPYAAVHTLVLLMMCIMMPETY